MRTNPHEGRVEGGGGEREALIKSLSMQHKEIEK